MRTNFDSIADLAKDLGYSVARIESTQDEIVVTLKSLYHQTKTETLSEFLKRFAEAYGTEMALEKLNEALSKAMGVTLHAIPARPEA